MSSDEITSIRNELGYYMVDSCVVKTKGYTKDAYGNTVEGFTASGTYDCLFTPLERVEGVFGGQGFEREMSKVWYNLTLPYDATIGVGDIIDKSSTEFEVVRVFSEQTNIFSKRAVIVLVEGDIT